MIFPSIDLSYDDSFTTEAAKGYIEFISNNQIQNKMRFTKKMSSRQHNLKMRFTCTIPFIMFYSYLLSIGASL